MEIFINGVAIDVQLEAERTMGDVVTGLAEWLRGTGHRLTTVSFDGAGVDAQAAQSDSRGVDTVHRVELFAQNVREPQLQRLETVHDYADVLRRVLLKGNAEQLQDVLEEYPRVAPAVAELSPDAAADIAEAMGCEIEPEEPPVVPVERRERSAAAVGRLVILTEGRIRELLEPLRELTATAGVLQPVLDALEQVPVQLQTGADREAVATITRFSELAAKLARLVTVIMEDNPSVGAVDVAGKPLNQAIADDNAILTDVLDAFDRRDYVLVGDLLEYEVVPRYRAFVAALVEQHDPESYN